MIKQRPAALVFDMDGTLLDTEPLYTEATQKILDPFNAVYSMEVKQRTIGGDSRKSAQITIDHYDLPHTVDEYLDERETHLLELFPHAPEMPGAADFISQAAASGLQLGLATSTHRHLYDIKMPHRHWGGLFDAIVCGDDPELHQGKPAPDIFLLCAKRLNVEPHACVAFEDSPNGIQAATAAGMTVIAIASPYVKPDALADAERVISNYEELNDLLASWAHLS